MKIVFTLLFIALAVCGQAPKSGTGTPGPAGPPGSGAQTPATSAPICGNGAANGTQVCDGSTIVNQIGATAVQKATAADTATTAGSATSAGTATTAAGATVNQTEPISAPSGTFAAYSYSNPNVSTPVGITQTQVNAKIIRVSDFGILNDGTDHTTAMNNLMANAPAGSLIQFPCSTNGSYVFTGQLNFKGNHIYRGDIGRSSSGCPIVSSYGGGVGSGAAFNFLGASALRFEDITFKGSNCSTPPESLAQFGDISGSAGDNISGINVVFIGCAKTALVYSIAAEGQTWWKPEFDLLGGGALFGWYTADSDVLGICPTCIGGSNTDVHMFGIQAVDSTALAGTAAGHCLFGFSATGGSTGDMSFDGGYVATQGDLNGGANAFGSGFCFPAAIKGNISISNIRLEGGIDFSNSQASQISGLHFIGNRIAGATSGTLNFLNSTASQLTGLTMIGNDVNGASIGSTITSISNSFIAEPFTVAVTSKANSVVFNTANGGTMQLSTNLQFVNTTAKPTCDSTHVGVTYDDLTVTPDLLQICHRLASGVYGYQPLSNITTAAATFTPGTGVTSVTCSGSTTCDGNAGSLSLVGGTATTGTIATINWDTTYSTAPRWCSIIPRGAAIGFNIDHGVPSTIGMTITAGVTILGATLALDYQCKP